MVVKELSAVFKDCKAAGRAAFIPYVTAAWPTKEDTVPLMLALERGGADAIELGMPFSDPLADGPVIQKSSHEALLNGVTIDDCLNYVREARKQGLQCPIILMGYYNPFLGYGEERLVEQCKDATISGFIIVDIDVPDFRRFSGYCDKHGLVNVPLVAPTTTESRLAEIAEYASGYVYCVALTGVTGARKELPPLVGEYLERVGKHIKLPRALGFGLSTHEHFNKVVEFGEGAIMGSRIITVIREGGDTVQSRAEHIEKFVKYVVSGVPM